jgi:hypothetical protein
MHSFHLGYRSARAHFTVVLATACPLLGLSTGCGGETESTRNERDPLVAVCAESNETLPAGVWLCGESRTVECDAQPGTASPRTIYVIRDDGCDNTRLLVNEGPFELGETKIVVSERIVATETGAEETHEVCTSTLTVVDTLPPSAAPLETPLWPPNHEMHAVTAGECAGASDVCDPELTVHFTHATSDEPADAEGDGSHEPDIVFEDAGRVSLRAERQGGGNGRVYTLGFRASDESGNVADGECRVMVPHDSSGRAAIADGNAYHVAAH